ncbi:MAG: sigma 54-interacting transcriptional regulator, partial [Syntrophomonadaceae bacterium]|nr:sigma 54-interacting transcriptional regulator [Syntrophomonadaceae bacterium]
MKISEVMISKPCMLSPTTTITDTVKLFIQNRIDGAPVVHNKKLVGFVCKKQIYEVLVNQVNPDHTVDNVMITNVISCKPDDEIDTLWDKKVNCLPVVTDEGVVVGIVSKLDLVNYLCQENEDLKKYKIMKEEMDAVFEASFDYLFLTDAQGRVTKVNQAYYRITGIKPEEVIGKTMYELVAQGFYDRSCSVEVIETLKPVTFEQKVKTGRTVLVTGNPIFNEKGELIGVITNGRDITELNELRKRVEQVTSLSEHYQKELKSLRKAKNCVIASPVMGELMEQITRVAKFDSAILITGESGVGKEIVAEQIHLQSLRSDKPYIRINCASIPENLLESELFGYVEGAFTGAKKGGKMGIFELANGGTLLLDDIGELPLSMQAKLLRVIQENEVIRIGGTTTTKIDVRIIACTNRDLNEMVKKGEFRKDLYYRLNVIPIRIPPLRERREEIPVFIDYFLNQFIKRYMLIKQIDPSLIEELLIF